MSATIPALSLLAFLLPSSATAAEQTIPATVKSGLKVSVVDDRGSSVEGRIQEVSDRFVRLAVRGGSRDIPIEHIIRIERPDTVKNGALIGLASRRGHGLDCHGFRPAGRRRARLAHAVVNGVICAGMGALIDGAQDHRRTLYERGPRPQARLHPVIGRHVRGVAAAMRVVIGSRFAGRGFGKSLRQRLARQAVSGETWRK